ncbi:serine/threonine-protein kinase [Urbifossiella limnaea]|uniref:Serine/threonine-protein kinase PknD n=1 Tax=Urbifossiella limnaea TaxID=2528023 RepID=A0A517XPH4_9BACT|nr:serine/threonine-protein kinase [Urbifossiella limnaea]QDU19394.1 Serine/threonine-protein kinase PknD [Urbifossiella limnaea]
MARPVVGWLLIVAGLAAVVGGLGMGYIFRIVHETEQEREQWAVVYDGRARRPTHDPTVGYASAAASVVVGGLMLAIGFGARRVPSRRRRSVADGPARECPDCGEPMSARATRCYHCAGVIRVEVERGGRGSRRLLARPPAPPDREDPPAIPLAEVDTPRAAVDATEKADYAARFATPGTNATGAYVPAPDAAVAAAPVLVSGRYELGPELARGGMGVVHRAADRAFDREVAIKLLAPRLAGTPAADRFLDEARITGRLQHPSIPPVHEVGVLIDGNPYLVMKLIRGHTLADEIAAARRPSGRAEVGPAGLDDDRDRDAVDHRDRLLRAFEQVCLAVAFAHSRRVVHRDLKPQNVMVGAFGEVQVMDWGIAKELTAPAGSRPDAGAAEPGDGPEDRTRVGDVVGTPAYMPPEQARGENDRVDERADVFALGGVLCAILTGAAPYQGGSGHEVLGKAAAAELDDAAARLDDVAGAGRFPWLAKKCLAPDPADRFAHAGEVAAAVHDAFAKAEQVRRQAELADAADAADRAERVARRATRRAALFGGGGVALGAVLLVGAYLVSGADLGGNRAEIAAARERRSRELLTVVCDAVARGIDAGRVAPGADGDYRERMHTLLLEVTAPLGPQDRAKACLVEAAMAEAAGDRDAAARHWELAAEAYRPGVPEHTRLHLACDAVGWFSGPPAPGRMERLILSGAVRVIAPSAADPALPDGVRSRAAGALATAEQVGVLPGRP